MKTKKLNDSIDSDIERVSSPISLRKAVLQNSTMISPCEEVPSTRTNNNNNNNNNINEIDQRLKSLETFIKHKFSH